VRDDSGAYEGYVVPRFYDTLLAKLIVWGADRPAAIQRMGRALSEYKVVGILTTIPVLAQIVGHEDFRAGRISTAFLDRVLPTFVAERNRARSVAVIAAVLAEYERLGRRTIVESTPPSPDDWRTGRHPGWRS
jgi:acetyl/propionyl-CoA carboxylase alpha subunit